MITDGWIANLSDGTSVSESWIEGTPSPWQRLKIHCEKNGLYITRLRMKINGSTFFSPAKNAIGYFQAHELTVSLGSGSFEIDEENPRQVVRKIGFVDRKNGTNQFLVFIDCFKEGNHWGEARHWHNCMDKDGRTPSIIWAPGFPDKLLHLEKQIER